MSTPWAEVITALRALVDDFTTNGVEKLPPERDLAASLGVSRGTLRRALAHVEGEGVIYRVRGRAGGSFIKQVVESAPIHSAMFELRSNKLIRDLNHVAGVPQMLARQGRSARTEIIAESLEQPTGSIARLLGIGSGEPVVSLLRLRYADEETWSLERIYLSAERFPNLLDLSPIEALYQELERHYGVSVHSFEEHIEVNPADARVAGLLGIHKGAPLYAMRRVSWDENGDPVETSVDFFRTDRTRLRLAGWFDSGDPRTS